MAQEQLNSLEPPDLPSTTPVDRQDTASEKTVKTPPKSSSPSAKSSREEKIASPSSSNRSSIIKRPVVSEIITHHGDDPIYEEVEPERRRRSARRRPAAPSREQIAANDDTPSIGGLIYALNQKPSNTPYRYATISSIAWGVISFILSWYLISSKLSHGQTFGSLFTEPSTYAFIACSLIPVAGMWFIALLAWRAEELRLRSSAMAEVAIRLAEPDRMAEQSIASLGQSVRRQVSFMNDAVGRALGRAGELEALVHNEVSVLEHSYEENERKIRGLIQELSGERTALLGTSERVSDTLRSLGTEIPQLIDRLSSQQIKLSAIIQIAGENLTSVENAVEQTADRLETTLGQRTEEMHNILVGYTSGLAEALNSRTAAIEKTFTDYLGTLNSSLEGRTANLQSGFENYARALEAAVSERANALSTSMEKHISVFSDTIQKQTADLEEQIVQGLGAVRRTSETISRQSLKAIEGLASHSDMLRSVTENLLTQINTVTNRFESQGQTIMNAANALEAVNFKIDTTLQNRHSQLSQTLETLSGKAEEFGRFVQTYSSSIETTLSDAEIKARAAAEELKLGAEKTKNAALADIDRLKFETDAEGARKVQELRSRFAELSSSVSTDLDHLYSRVDITAEDVRQKAAQISAETDAESARKVEELRARFAELNSTVSSDLENLTTRMTSTAEDVRLRTAKLSAETDAESVRKFEELRTRFSVLASNVSNELQSLSTRVDTTADDVRKRAAKISAEIAAEQSDIREQLDRLPVATRESANLLRRALSDQLKALDQLSALTQKTLENRDITPPIGTYPASSGMPRIGEVSSSPRAPINEEKVNPVRPTAPPTPPTAKPNQNRDTWSLGDLLARASNEEEFSKGASAPRWKDPFKLDLQVISRSLDINTTSAIWTRVASGQRGVLSRDLYTVEGRMMFDEVSRRLPTDQELQRSVMHYLEDFEKIKRELDARDPSGRMTTNHLMSDTGRVYLFLAHVAGRIT